MLRSIVEAWLPLLGWLAACAVTLGLLLRLGRGAAANHTLGLRARWRELPGCESGSVQSLAFVLTFPAFLMVVLLIIQISQLMLGIAVVHYAAFSAARSASVWLPAHTDLEEEQANHVMVSSLDRAVMAGPGGGGGQFPFWMSVPQFGQNIVPGRVGKMHRVWRAAVLGCAPLAPSRRVTNSEPGPSPLSDASVEAWQLLVQRLDSRGYYRTRLQRQLDYSAFNTLVVLRGRDADGATGPTYNPFPGHYQQQYDPLAGQTVPVWIPWDPFELGWEDPVTVSVYHNYALLPGPGRFLSERLVAPRTPDLVSRHLREQQGGHPLGYQRGLYVVTLEAHSTLQLEGLKSVMPYLHTR